MVGGGGGGGGRGGGGWSGVHSHFHVQPRTTVEVRLSLSWGFDKNVCRGPQNGWRSPERGKPPGNCVLQTSFVK